MSLDLSALELEAPPPPAARGLALVAPLSAFEEDPDKPRFEDEDAEEFALLVADVRRHGILQPVVVRRMPSQQLRLRFGHRRYRAACALQLSGLPYVVTEDPRQFDDYTQVAENQRHKPLQPLELAGFIVRKLAQGEKKREVAARLGIDASAVTHLLALVDAPPLVLELYHGRRCRSPQYLYALRKLVEQQPGVAARHAATAAEIDRAWLASLSAEVHALRPPAADAPAAAPPAVRAAAPGDAVPRTISSPRLLGNYAGRALTVLLERLPSEDGLVWVRFEEGGAVAEVPIGAVQLTALREARRGGLRVVGRAERGDRAGPAAGSSPR